MKELYLSMINSCQSGSIASFVINARIDTEPLDSPWLLDVFLAIMMFFIGHQHLCMSILWIFFADAETE